jgi:preprotein translocase subunit YajC
MSFYNILLQAATTPTTTAAPGAGQGMSSFIMIGLVIVVFYFFMMRPQMKKQKQQASFMNEIGKGSRIVTIGGIHGKITEVREKTFVIEVEGGTKLQIMKSAVSLENSKAVQDDGSGIVIDKKD